MLGQLGTMRSVLSIYYGDMEGQYPSDLRALTVGGKYLKSMPLAWGGVDTQYSEGHARSDDVVNFSIRTAHDSGKWGYVNDPNVRDPVYGADYGSVFIDCTHTDNKGTAWSSY